MLSGAGGILGVGLGILIPQLITIFSNTLTIIREHLNPKVQILGILLTMFDGRTIHSREALELLESNYGDRIMRTQIRKTIKFAEAPVQGESVLKYDKSGKAANMYRELAQEVLEIHVTQAI